MKLMELFPIMETLDDEREHAKALAQTGFWGRQGAGCIFLARDTKRFLIAHRSRQVEEPGTFGTWGGAIDSKENPANAVRREAFEEAGYNGHLDLIPLYVFKAEKDGKIVFRYSNFLAVVDREFTPKLNWESEGYKWCEYGKWPSPLHPGLVKLLSDPESQDKIKRGLKALSNPAKDSQFG